MPRELAPIEDASSLNIVQNELFPKKFEYDPHKDTKLRFKNCQLPLWSGTIEVQTVDSSNTICLWDVWAQVTSFLDATTS